MPLGLTTTANLTQVSTHEQLLKDKVTSGHGAPTHKPEVPAQEYFDADDLTKMYIWRNSGWTASVTFF